MVTDRLPDDTTSLKEFYPRNLTQIRPSKATDYGNRVLTSLLAPAEGECTDDQFVARSKSRTATADLNERRARRNKLIHCKQEQQEIKFSNKKHERCNSLK